MSNMETDANERTCGMKKRSRVLLKWPRMATTARVIPLK